MQSGGADLTLPEGTNFTYPDLNSQVRSACGQYGYSPEDNTTCWIQIVYEGVTGWVPRAVSTKADGYSSAICFITSLSDETTYVTVPEDRGYHCQLAFFVLPFCFPGDAVVMRPDGQAPTNMSQLQLGDQVRL